MQIKCAKCGSLLRAEDVNLDALLGKCRACNEVFSIADQAPFTPLMARKLKTDVAMPSKFRVEGDVSGLTISYRWFTPAAFFLLFFCIGWDSFLVFWYAMALGHGAGPMQWIAIVFPIAHVAVGVGLSWLVLAMFLNTTTIRVNYEQLTIRSGPVPFFGNKRLAAADIQQLYCDESVTRNENTTSRQFLVNVRTIDGRKIKLITGLNERDQALFIEQQIERFLDIKDEPMPGELSAAA